MLSLVEFESCNPFVSNLCLTSALVVISHESTACCGVTMQACLCATHACVSQCALKPECKVHRYGKGVAFI